MVFPPFGIPDSYFRVLAGIAIVGYPVALVSTLIFDSTRARRLRVREVVSERITPAKSDNILDWILIGLVVLVLAYFWSKNS